MHDRPVAVESIVRGEIRGQRRRREAVRTAYNVCALRAVRISTRRQPRTSPRAHQARPEGIGTVDRIHDKSVGIEADAFRPRRFEQEHGGKRIA